MNMPIEVRQVMSGPPEDCCDVESLDARSEHLLRDLAPQVLGAVVRRFRDFAAAEDAVQEALLAAAMQWPREGVARQSARLADPGRLPAHDRSRAQRDGSPAPGNVVAMRVPAIVTPAPASTNEPSRTTRSSCSSCAAIPR